MGATAWSSVVALFLTSAASVIALLREKRDESTSEHRLRRWLKPVLFVITAIGLPLGIYTARTSDKANRDATQKHFREQQELQGKLDSSLLEQQYTRAQLDSITLMVSKFTQTDKSPAAKNLATIVNQTAAKKSPGQAGIVPSKDDLLPDISDSMLQYRAMQVSVELRNKWDVFNQKMEHLEVQREIVLHAPGNNTKAASKEISKLNKEGSDSAHKLFQEPLLDSARAILKQMNDNHDQSMEQASLKEIVNRIKDIQYRYPEN